MSKTPPMGHMTRRYYYFRGREDYGGFPSFPGQRRRWKHKLRRQLGRFLAGDGHYPGEILKPSRSPAKGRPTPRRPRRG